MTPASTARLAWYGDDFTGATDTLATAAQAGLRALLFLGVPTPEQWARAGELDAVGIAGAARAMAPDAMRQALEPVGRFFAQLRVPVVHYKVCSTFDSAPTVGNIATAIATLRQHVENPLVPIVGGQPSLGRYCLFGNLFARAGSGGVAYRIDRHPTMSSHPVTPMREADLRRHLALQGLEPVAGFDYPLYSQPESVQEAALDTLLAVQPAAVLFDVGRADDLLAVGRLIWRRAQRARMLVVGASSVVQALAAQRAGHAEYPELPSAVGMTGSGGIAPAAGPVLLLAGSLSPITAHQVDAASSYVRVVVDAGRLVHGGPAAMDAVVSALAEHLRAGRSALAVTAGSEAEGASSHAIAQASGRLLARVLQQVPLRRVGIAGGDTSSLGVQALDAWGLSYLAALAPGVALCRLHSDVQALDGMEIMLKGGQMGQVDLFERLLHGSR